ncbi:Putative adhesin [Streptomyces sp. 1222.5]|uniref:DUF4097 family beta strand repeat-containing protein n=1 Tax=unclassified Streptomyces TaxID=2593676 RepID=UPI000896347F|nr:MULTISPECIES: DUF4097 family beta strand repeat-containing protein [unclassified Streptomyces]PKW05062.1 putative adhesin [Streptomyces sp. 5112.2]PKW10189.1 putative adhesin [Streptomyces sp. 5112.2]SEB54041.1 Putative adhesin [Streptomyces sp. 1222.5]SEC12829.1 Putative adhesin [Streptomyces sp. 1222.5]SED79467.1 Putative adhesin [Streptomyces sp. 2231.1]
MPKFATPAPVTAHLDIPAGRIQLIAADRADTTVEILPADPSKGRDVKAAERIDVSYDAGVLRITAREPAHRVLGNPGSVEVTVQLPAGSHLHATAALAELRGVGRLGHVTLDAAQATVKLDETDEARLTLKAGDITLGRLAGPADISTQKGDLTVTEAHRGTLTLRTQHGRICVGAARGTSATLDAGTAYGRIHNALANTDGATAGLTIHASTGYGDIDARSL